jgi:hypothetical protein
MQKSVFTVLDLFEISEYIFESNPPPPIFLSRQTTASNLQVLVIMRQPQL